MSSLLEPGSVGLRYKWWESYYGSSSALGQGTVPSGDGFPQFIPYYYTFWFDLHLHLVKMVGGRRMQQLVTSGKKHFKHDWNAASYTNVNLKNLLSKSFNFIVNYEFNAESLYIKLDWGRTTTGIGFHLLCH